LAFKTRSASKINIYQIHLISFRLGNKPGSFKAFKAHVLQNSDIKSDFLEKEPSFHVTDVISEGIISDERKHFLGQFRKSFLLLLHLVQE